MGAIHPPWQLNHTGSRQPRRATRDAAQLDARLLFQLPAHKSPETNNVAAHAPHNTLRLVGRTRNISETGLAFIVPTLRIGDEFARVIGSRLLITLYLPSGHIEIHATPVRYEQ
ncbi:MAG TPA: PilZ domain-containing protein, partial [Pyrinomonadaceae bacterium]